jgi:hypothetical protein
MTNAFGRSGRNHCQLLCPADRNLLALAAYLFTFVLISIRFTFSCTASHARLFKTRAFLPEAKILSTDKSLISHLCAFKVQSVR